MKYRLKRLRDQVLVLTGASSGIGLVTARMAAQQGARLVLAARSGDELETLANEINRRGGSAVPVVADVGREEDVQRIANAALHHFGRFDTWVNDAGVSIFGRLQETSLEDSRRLFETNFWGMVYGSLVAVRNLPRFGGGALINVGSVASDRAFPLQGMYSASKHAVKGFTDALRMELEHDKVPISVTLIKPTAIGTPLPQHARNYLGVEPTLPAPVYAPELVARAILHCAVHPERDVFVGGAAKALAMSGAYAPRLTDRLMEATMFSQQRTNWPPRGDHASLHHPSHDLTERGEFPRHIFETSAYTEARLHPVLSSAAVLGVGLVAAGALWALLGQPQGSTGTRTPALAGH